MSLGLLSALEFEDKTKGKVVSGERTQTTFRGTQSETRLEPGRTGWNRLALGWNSRAEPVGTWLQPCGPERRGPPDDEIV